MSPKVMSPNIMELTFYTTKHEMNIMLSALTCDEWKKIYI